MTIQDIQAKYTDLLHRFVVGLIHDETEAHAIVVLCFEYLRSNIHLVEDEKMVQGCLENSARELSINYINKKENERRNRD